jgi:cleavage stimulation factor subunit 3
MAHLGLGPSLNQVSPQKPTFTTEDRVLASAWRNYLKWEEGNPLGIENSEDLTRRLRGVYRKAVVKMRYFIEMW